LGIHEVTEEEWDEVIKINLKSLFWLTKFVIPYMIKQKFGVIINNASIQAIASQKGVSHYAASKGAMVALTRQLAVQYGEYKIRVNSLSPGSTMTPLMAANTNPEYPLSNTPMKVLGEPEDMANMVYFLSSRGARWVTGQNIVVDGGITIKGGWAKL